MKGIAKITSYLILATVVAPLTAYTPSPQERVVQLSKQVEKLEGENVKLLKQITLLKKSIADKVESARHSFHLVEREKNAEIERLNTRIEQVRKEKEYLSTNKSKVEQELATKNKQISVHAKSMRRMKQHYQQESAKLQKSIIQLNKAISAVTGERDLLAKNQKELNEQVSLLESRHDEPQTSAEQQWSNTHVAGLAAIVSLGTFALTKHIYDKQAS